MRALVVDVQSHFLYISDFSNNAIRRIDPTHDYTTITVATGISNPYGISIDYIRQRLYVTSSYVQSQSNARFCIYSVPYSNPASFPIIVDSTYILTGFKPTSSVSTSVYDGSLLSATFQNPTALYFDSVHDLIYVSDTFNPRPYTFYPSIIRRVSLSYNNVSTIAGACTSIYRLVKSFY